MKFELARHGQPWLVHGTRTENKRKEIIMPSPLRRAFTLVELLVVSAIIGVLGAWRRPAVQTARGGARRSQCINNLRQLGIALHTHHDQFGVLPFARTGGRPQSISWAPLLLPFIEQKNLLD